MVLDFSSLYPSLIMEYNICFTTQYQDEEQGTGIDPSSPGILPSVL